MAQIIKNKPENYDLPVELLQPWSTFVMATELPPPILKKMIKITDEIIENKKPEKRAGKDLAGEIEDEFFIDFEILEQEGVMGFFLDVCRNYVIRAQCQSKPFKKIEILKETWLIEMIHMWMVSQKDNEYNPVHTHGSCHISAVMYLKIPEYLPSRKTKTKENGEIAEFCSDGAISFSNNSSTDKIWGDPTLQIQPKVGQFLIFPAKQRHQVYPFRTLDGKGERRSVSFNAAFTSKSKQDGIKQQKKKY